MNAWKRRLLTVVILLTPVAALAATVAANGGCPWPCPCCP